MTQPQTHGERIAIPLVMLPGNMEILLDNIMPCSGVSLARYSGGELPDGLDPGEDAVVLVLHGLSDAEKDRLGFKSTEVPR